MPTPPIDRYDDRALGERPPRTSAPTGATPAADPKGSATGRPALAQTTDGTANLRATTVTKQAGDARATSSGVKATRAAVDSYNPAGV